MINQSKLDVDAPELGSPNSSDSPEEIERHREVSMDLAVRERKVTLLGNAAVILCGVTGAGILGVPYALEQVGWVLGIVMMLLSASLTYFGLFLLGEVYIKVLEEKREEERAGHFYLYFGDAAALIDPKWLPLVVDALVFFGMSTVCIMYLGITGDFLHQAFAYINPAGEQEWYQSRTLLLTTTFCLFSAPASFLKSFNRLQMASYLGAAFIMYTVALLVFYAFVGEDRACSRFLQEHNMEQCPDSTTLALQANLNLTGRCCDIATQECCIGEIKVWEPSFRGILYAWPIFSTAFSCSGSAFKCMNDLIRPTRRRINTGMGSALILKIVVDFVLGLAAVFTFGSNVSRNVLSNYSFNMETTIARISLGLLVALTFPLQFQAARGAFLHFIDHCVFLHTGQNLLPRSARIIFFCATSVQLAIIYIIALQNVPLTVLLNFTGALTLGQMAYTLPAYFYLRIVRPVHIAPRIACYLLIAYSLGLAVLDIAAWGMRASQKA